MNQNLMSFRLATPAQRLEAQAFYDLCGYAGTEIAPHDRVLLARRGDQLVGIVRLCPENGFCCLRGMQVLPDYRRLGIGSQLLGYLLPLIGEEPCLSLPFRHLERFYGQIGLQRLALADLPGVLQQRMQAYQTLGIDVIAMGRGWPPSGA